MSCSINRTQCEGTKNKKREYIFQYNIK